MDDRSRRATGWLLAAVVPVAVLAGALWLGAHRRAPSTPAPQAAPAATSAPEAGASPAAPAREAAATPAAPAAAPHAPGFDLVRVEPDGKAVVVGTAAPGAKVTIFADDAPVAEADADDRGNFVALFSVTPSEAPRALTLGAAADGRTARSDDVVMLLPRTPAAPAVEAGEPGPEPAKPEVAATAIVRPSGVEVAPPAGAPTAPRAITLGSISYAATGDVRLGGVGTAGAVLRVYVDGRFAAESRVAGDGRWSASLPDLAEGIYRLRVDQLGSDGAVTSRVETPFQRDFPPMPRPGSADIVAGADGTPELTVQPGTNLWTLARLHYGSGVEYTRIYTANRDLIRDPDLIYPGQIFRMPGAEPAQ